MSGKTLPYQGRRQKRGGTECRKALKTRSQKMAWGVPSLPAVTPLTASAPTFQRLPLASEAQSPPAVSARQPESEFAALISSFADALPNESACPAPAPVKDGLPLKNGSAALLQAVATETLPAKGGKADSSKLDETNNSKTNLHETSLSPIAVDVVPVKLNEPVLPLTLGWNSGASTLVQSVHEATNGAPIEEKREAPVVFSPAPQPISSAPRSDAPVQVSRLDVQVPEELTSALTMSDLVATTSSPKTALAFEAHLKQNVSNTTAPASLTSQQTPNGQHELSATASHELSRAVVPYPVEAAKQLEHSSRKEPERANQTSQQLKSEVASETASKGSSDSARQDQSESRDRKTSTGDTDSLTLPRHGAGGTTETTPEANMAAPTAPRTAAKQTESATPVEKHSLTAGTQQDVPESAAPRTEPARDISFRMGSGSANAVDIKLTERAGQIRVAVHSADPALTRSLQANVTELAGKLEKSGFHAETFLPNGAQASREAQANPNFQDSSKDRRAPHYEPQRQKKRSNETEFQINMLTNTHQENS